MGSLHLFTVIFCFGSYLSICYETFLTNLQFLLSIFLVPKKHFLIIEKFAGRRSFERRF